MKNTRLELRVDAISNLFGTDEFTTRRIMSNFCFGFFVKAFGEKANEMWETSRPFYCENPDCKNLRDYSIIDAGFLQEHFELFASNQFWTCGEWQHNEITKKCDWVYKSGYYQVQPMFINSPVNL